MLWSKNLNFGIGVAFCVKRCCHENPAKYEQFLRILTKNGQKSLCPCKDTCPEIGMKFRSPKSWIFSANIAEIMGHSHPSLCQSWQRISPLVAPFTGVAEVWVEGVHVNVCVILQRKNLGRRGDLGFAFFRNLRNYKHNKEIITTRDKQKDIIKVTMWRVGKLVRKYQHSSYFSICTMIQHSITGEDPIPFIQTLCSQHTNWPPLEM